MTPQEYKTKARERFEKFYAFEPTGEYSVQFIPNNPDLWDEIKSQRTTAKRIFSAFLDSLIDDLTNEVRRETLEETITGFTQAFYEKATERTFGDEPEDEDKVFVINTRVFYDIVTAALRSTRDTSTP